MPVFAARAMVWEHMVSVSGKARYPARQRTGTDGQDMKRIAIIGNAGSGKSTLARALAARFDLPCHELDALLWSEGWVPADPAIYETEHARILAQPAWVIDGLGQWDSLPDRIARAQAIVFCDFPLWQHFWLLAERQAKWAAGTLDNRPGGLTEPPPTALLFETVWQIEQDWMPELRAMIKAVETAKPVYHIPSVAALQAFTWPAA